MKTCSVQRQSEGYSYTLSFIMRTREETEAGWYDEYGQGNHEARLRGWACVVRACTEKEDALRLSALFCRNVFAIPSCTHWDGSTLSMYCGDAGRGYLHTLARAESLRLDDEPEDRLPLFCEDTENKPTKV